MVDVVVDDKGTTKKMAVDQRQLKKAMDGTAASSRNARKQIRGAAQTASASGKQFAALSAGTGGLVGAYATLAAQIFAVTAAFNFLKSAGSLKLLQEGQMAYTSAVGTSMKALTTDIQNATGAQLSFQEAAQAGAIATAAGLAPDQITALGKAAKDTSTILGRDLTDSFNRLVRGVTKAEPELLDELGIILRLEDAQQKYKDSLGITGELNAFQRSQAVTADVLAQVEEKYSRVLAVTGASENEFQKLGKAFDDIVNSIREFSVKFLTPVAQLLQEYPPLIAAAFAPFTVSILRGALPGLTNLQSSLNATAATAKTSFATAQTAQKKYFTDIKKLAASKSLRDAARQEIGAETKAATKKVKINKGSLLARLRDGKKLTNAQLKQIEINLQKEARGYKIKDKKVLASLRASMKKMEIINQSTSNRIQKMYATMGLKIGASFKQAEMTGKAAMAGLAAFTAKAAGAMAVALNALSWITLIASLGALVYAFFRTKEGAEEVADKFDYLGDKAATLAEETEKFIAVQNILNEEFDRGNFAVEAFAKRLENVSSVTIADALATSNLQEAMDGFTNSVVAARNKIPQLEKDLEDLRKTQDASLQSASLGKGSEFIASNNQNDQAVQQQRIIEQIEAATKQASLSFSEYINTQGGITDATKNAVNILMREKDELEGLTNERFKQNLVVAAYRDGLDKLENKQQVDIDQLLAQRDAVQKLGRQFSELTRLQGENARTNAQLITKILPLSETDTYLDKLSQEKFLLMETIKANKGAKTASEQRRLNEIEKAQTFFGSVAITETSAKQAVIALDIQQAKLLAGKTKLIQQDVKASVAIAKNKVKEFQLEQKIGQAQKLLAKDKAEQLRLSESDNENERERAKEMKATNDARERSIIVNSRNLELLKLQTAELERQKNNVQQLRDAIMQSFESGVESGLAKFIKAEQQFADAFRDMVKGVLNSVADTLAKQLTTGLMKKITGVKAPEELMADAIKNSSSAAADDFSDKLAGTLDAGGTAIANKIRAATGAAPLSTTGAGGTTGGVSIDPNSGLPTNDPSKGPGIHSTAAPKSSGLLSYLFARGGQTGTVGGRGEIDPEHGEVEESKVVGKKLGIFGPFLNDFSAIFEENSGEGGFLGKLGKSFTSLLGGFGSLFTDLLGGLGGDGGFLSSIFGGLFGGGGVARYGMKPMGYAIGGIARGPQAGYPAVLHGTEAVVPLPSGGKIPVEMKGGGNPTTNNVGVTVNVSGEGATSNVSGDPGQGEQLGRVISAAVQDELHKQRRPGGILSPYGAAGGI